MKTSKPHNGLSHLKPKNPKAVGQGFEFGNQLQEKSNTV